MDSIIFGPFMVTIDAIYYTEKLTGISFTDTVLISGIRKTVPINFSKVPLQLATDLDLIQLDRERQRETDNFVRELALLDRFGFVVDLLNVHSTAGVAYLALWCAAETSESDFNFYLKPCHERSRLAG